MKLTSKWFVLVGFIVLLSCMLSGCSSKNKAITNTYVENTTDNAQSSVKKDMEGETTNQNVSSMSIGETSVMRNYVLYVVNLGEVEGTKNVQKMVDSEVVINDIYLELLIELVEYIGYDVQFNSITVGNGVICVDLHESSEIFYRNAFHATMINPVQYECYDDMVFGILDSMMMTLKENHGSDVDIIYTKDSDILELPIDSIELSLEENEVYQGWYYYKNLFLSRAEGKVNELIDLGMSYNEVMVILYEQGVKFDQDESFSLLGDHTDWENFNSMDEFLGHSWVHISIYGDGYKYEFDGSGCTLMEISVEQKEVSSSRGLMIGSMRTELISLYGDMYDIYNAGENQIYEYNLEDCYFRALVDTASGSVLSFGKASYAYEDYLIGKTRYDEVQKKQALNEYRARTQNLGL